MTYSHKQKSSVMIQGTKLIAEELFDLQEHAASVPFFSGLDWQFQQSGAVHAGKKGRGMQYDESRLYQTGDDTSHMDWRVTARTGQAHVKLFREDIEKSVFFVIDQSPSMQFGTRRAFKSIQAAHAAILTAWLASSQSYKVGGMILGQDSLAHSPLYLKQKGVEHLINTLLKGTHAGNSVPFDGNLSEIVPQLRQHLLPGASLVILSDFYNTNSEFISFLGYLATHYEVTVIFVYDPLEKDVPEGEVVTLENGSQQAVLDGRSSQFRRSYHEQFRHHQGKLEASCLKNGVNFVALATNQEPKEIFADNTHSLIN